ATTARGDDESVVIVPADSEMSPTSTNAIPAEAELIRRAAAVNAVRLPRRQSLLSADSFPGQQWVFFPGKKDTRIEETWSIASQQGEAVLVCRGEPHGYLRTTTMYQDFELGLEWRFPKDEHGNSGVLMFTSGEDRIWPTAVQVQLHKPKTGSIFGSGGAQVVPEVESRELMRPVDQWNKMQILCRQGEVQVSINGKSVGQAQVVSPQAGAIGLQSEGSEVHFRNLWIRDLQPAARAADVGQPMSLLCPPVCPPTSAVGPNLPTQAVWNSYPGVSSWSWTQLPPRPVSVAPPARASRNVAHGNTLAGGYTMYHPGRYPAASRAAASEWDAGGGRVGLRAARGGRHRR
ncbi:MAG: DUF1080 domain-containing protein, partial [Planctomycetaceae bacterium]